MTSAWPANKSVSAMRASLVALAAASAASAQAPAPPAAPVTFATAAEVHALVARAKATIAPGAPSINLPLLRLAPWRAMVEYRRAPTIPQAHLADAELVYVAEGRGTLVLGGALADEKPLNAGNRTGSAITGGRELPLAPGNWVLIPTAAPHWFRQVEGELVVVTLHLPPTPPAG
jgi:mannose-6-phosphate isomerase-like protein (cupin superfamily)